MESNNFRGVTLLSHILKLRERILKRRLRKMVIIREIQYMGSNLETQRSNHCSDCGRYTKTQRVRTGVACGVCEPGKGFYRVPMELIW